MTADKVTQSIDEMIAQKTKEMYAYFNDHKDVLMQWHFIKREVASLEKQKETNSLSSADCKSQL